LPLNSHVTLDEHWGHGEKRFTGPCRYWDLLNQRDVLLIELGFGEPAGEAFPGVSKNPSEWLTILNADGRRVFFFLLHIPKAECLRRVAARGNLSPAYTEHAWQRYAPGGDCSGPVFGGCFASPISETAIDTMAHSLPQTVEIILRTVLQQVP